MSERISRGQIDHLAALTSVLLPGGLKLEVTGTGGGFSLDIYNDGIPTRTLTYGTKREVWDYLHAFREGIFLRTGSYAPADPSLPLPTTTTP